MNTNKQSSKIGLITPAGHISEFSLSPPESNPIGITSGLDGNLWFAEVSPTAQNGKYESLIGRMTPTGQLSEFPLPTATNVPQFLTTGPDGAIWFTEFGSDGRNGKIGRLA